VCVLYRSCTVLWCCWLGGRKGVRPVKTEYWGAGVVICLEQGADLNMAQLMPLPLIVSGFSKIQIGFSFLVPAHQGSPRQRAVKRVCMCVLYRSWRVVSVVYAKKIFHAKYNVLSLQGPLVRWLKVNFGEAFIAWIHVKALRVFVESVLRYLVSLLLNDHCSANY